MQEARAERWVAEMRLNGAVGDLGGRRIRLGASAPQPSQMLMLAADCAERLDVGWLPDEAFPPGEEHRLQHAPTLPAKFGRPARTRKTALPAAVLSTSRKAVSCAYPYCLTRLDGLLLA